MRHILARLGALPGADHRAVFHRFAACLERLLRRRPGEARVRVVRG